MYLIKLCEKCVHVLTVDESSGVEKCWCYV